MRAQHFELQNSGAVKTAAPEDGGNKGRECWFGVVQMEWWEMADKSCWALKMQMMMMQIWRAVPTLLGLTGTGDERSQRRWEYYTEAVEVLLSHLCPTREQLNVQGKNL